VQILAYADDIDIISRSPKSLQKATIALDRAARRMGLEINQAKTKYMICGTKKNNVENILSLILMDPCIVVWFSRNNQQDATL
jgi:CO dehydrogenase/acetyl-CoA synthase gamma subunit (corrinoid Fe-S protein)